MTYVEITAGRLHSAARRSDGSVVAWLSVPALAVMVIPLYGVVWRFRCLRLAIFVHCAANIVGAVLWFAG